MKYMFAYQIQFADGRMATGRAFATLPPGQGAPAEADVKAWENTVKRQNGAQSCVCLGFFPLGEDK